MKFQIHSELEVEKDKTNVSWSLIGHQARKSGNLKSKTVPMNSFKKGFHSFVIKKQYAI